MLLIAQAALNQSKTWKNLKANGNGRYERSESETEKVCTLEHGDRQCILFDEASSQYLWSYMNGAIWSELSSDEMPFWYDQVEEGCVDVWVESVTLYWELDT